MAKRQKSPVEVLLDTSARLGWIANAVLAIGTHFVFRWIAAQKPEPSEGLTDLGGHVLWTAAASLSSVLQWLVPLLIIFGGLAGALRRQRQGQLVARVATSPQETLNALSWREFEELISGHFRQQGYSVTSNSGAGPDGGVDIELRRNGELHLVQCKHWRARKVPVGTVRELYGVMAARGAAGGYIVSSGQFTQDAVTFASGRNIDLLDGAALIARFGRQEGEIAASLPTDDTSQTPDCPKCGSKMVQRVAKRGPSAGSTFWGCESYPRCRGTRALS